MSKLFVLSGNQVLSNHATEQEALNAALIHARQGKTVQVVQLSKTVAPNSGVIVTDATTNAIETLK